MCTNWLGRGSISLVLNPVAVQFAAFHPEDASCGLIVKFISSGFTTTPVPEASARAWYGLQRRRPCATLRSDAFLGLSRPRRELIGTLVSCLATEIVPSLLRVPRTVAIVLLDTHHPGAGVQLLSHLLQHGDAVNHARVRCELYHISRPRCSGRLAKFAYWSDLAADALGVPARCLVAHPWRGLAGAAP